METGNRKVNKVMLIVPNCTLPAGRIKVATPPLGLMYLAGVLEENDYRVKILDSSLEGYRHEVKINERDITYGMTDEALKDEIARYAPDVVGVTCQSSIQFKNTVNACKAAKAVNKSVPVVADGYTNRAVTHLAMKATFLSRLQCLQ